MGWAGGLAEWCCEASRPKHRLGAGACTFCARCFRKAPFYGLAECADALSPTPLPAHAPVPKNRRHRCLGEVQAPNTARRDLVGPLAKDQGRGQRQHPTGIEVIGARDGSGLVGEMIVYQEDKLALDPALKPDRPRTGRM